MNNTQEPISDYFKNKRDQYIVDIRKERNSQTIKKKRARLCYSSKITLNFSEFQKAFEDLAIKLLAGIRSNDENMITKTVEEIRVVLSSTGNPPISVFEASGMIDQIIQYITPQYHQNNKLVGESAWILSIYASGEEKYTKYLVDKKVDTLALDLLYHPDLEVKENAIWILANMALEKKLDCRDRFLAGDICQRIDDVMKSIPEEGYDYMHESVAWLISTLCSGPPYPQFYLLTEFMKHFEFFLEESTSDQVLSQTLWAISHFVDGLEDEDNSQQIELFLALNLVDRIIDLLESEENEVVNPALKCVMKVLTGTDDQVSYMIGKGVLYPLVKFLDHPKKLFVRNACVSLSNIFAASSEQIQEALNYQNGIILTKLVELMKGGRGIDITTEALYCFVNICCNGTFEQMKTLVKNDLLGIFSDVLKNLFDPDVIKLCIEGLEAFLKKCRIELNLSEGDRNPYVEMCMESGIYDRLNDLVHSHKDQQLCGLIIKVIDKNFGFQTN